MERFVGLVNEVEEYYISAGNTSLECQNIYSKVWFPGAIGGTAIVCLFQRLGWGGWGAVGGPGPARHLVQVYSRRLLLLNYILQEKPPMSHFVNLISIHF